MGAYQTDKRDLTTNYGRVFRGSASGWNTVVDATFSSAKHTQETYSYRTGKQKKDTSLGAVEPIHLGTQYNAFTDDPYNTFDTGHEFRTTRVREIHSHPHVRLQRQVDSSHTALYQGALLLSPTSLPLWDTFPSIANMSPNDIKFYGSLAIAQQAPTKPSSSLATAIGEVLLEGLPNLGATILELGQRAGYFQAIGSATLALKFGFEPFVRDLQKVARAVLSADSIMQQFLRDSGKQVRRRYNFHPTNSLSVSSGTGQIVGIPTELQGVVAGPVSIETTTTRSIWFSGAFLYNAPSQYNRDGQVDPILLAKKLDEVCNQVLGSRSSPEVLWEILPFSWLVDWLSSVGAAISNFTRFQDNDLVMRYGYLMRETSIVKRVVLPGGNRFNGYPAWGPISRSFICVKKERYRATPFGFGLDPNSFTASQWAILAALGLSQGGRKLP